MAVGDATSGILYSLFPKVTITAWGLDSYTACRFHKYGCPNNTSQASKGAMSHNTSSMKGLMLYGRRHCWLTRRSRPWWCHRWCTVVDVFRSVSPATSWPLPKWGSFGSHCRQWTVAGNPLPTSGTGRGTPPPLDLQVPPSRSSGSSFWIFVMAMVALGSALIICFAFSFPLSGFESESEHAFDSKNFSSATSDCLARHSLVLWMEILWNSHHFPVSFFDFTMFFFACDFGGLS